MRVDPTAAVRPERVDLGASAAAGTSREWYQAAWLLNLRNRWDIVNRWWNQAVTGFDALRQRGLLERLGIRHADPHPARHGPRPSASVTLLAGGLAVALWRRHEGDPLAPRDAAPAAQAWRALGIVRGLAEGPRDYLERAAGELPHERQRILDLLQTYLRLRYGPQQAETESVPEFPRAWSGNSGRAVLSNECETRTPALATAWRHRHAQLETRSSSPSVRSHSVPAPPYPSPWRAPTRRSPREMPAAAPPTGRSVRWGGEIISTEPEKGADLLHVLAHPLDSSARPKVDGPARAGSWPATAGSTIRRSSRAVAR